MAASRRRFGSEAYRSAVLADSPAAYWRLGESSGTTAVDQVGVYNGTYINSPTLGVDGIFAGNTAAGFNGTTQNVNCGTMAAFLNGRTVGLAIEAWIRTTAGGFIAGKWGPNSTQQRIYFIRDGNGSVSFGIYGGSGGSGGYRVGITPAGAAPNGVWTHVVGVWVSTTSMAIYINGVSQAITYFLTGTTTSSLAASTNDFRISSESAGNFFNGSIDEVAIYSSLSPARILAHYNAAGY